MSNRNFEDLSALADNELGADRGRFLIGRLADDDALVAAWRRWHLAGACLRGEVALLDDKLAQRVAAAIAKEPLLDASLGAGRSRPGSRTARFARNAAGLAIAASVAVVALMMAPRGLDQSGIAFDSMAARDSTPAPVLADSSPLVTPARIGRVAESGLTASDFAVPYRLDAQAVSSGARAPIRGSAGQSATPRGWLVMTPDGRVVAVPAWLSEEEAARLAQAARAGRPIQQP